MKFLASVQSLLGENALNLLVYAIIVIVFLIGLFECILPVAHNRNLIRRAIRSIRSGDDAKFSWQEDSFLGRGSLCEHWSEYLNNLFFADGVYHNASNVENYINEETVIYGPGRSAFSDAIPGLLVSLGFLGTLIGLAQGLSGFSMADSDAAMNSIVTLIPGMRYAFMTSIFGVIGSVLFTLITRVVHGSTEHTLRVFYGAMSRHAGVQSVDPMTQIAIYQQQQTDLIRQLSQDLSGNLSDNVAQAVGQAIEPLNNTLRAFVSVNTKEQMRFLDAVVSRFIDRMDETLNGQLKRLTNALNEAAASQEKNTADIREALNKSAEMLSSIREVSGAADEMVRGSVRYLEQLRQQQSASSDAITQVQNAASQMDAVSRRQADTLKAVNAMQTDTLKSLSAMQADITRSAAQMNEAFKSFSERMAKSTAEASTEMRKSASELRAAGAEIKQIHQNTSKDVAAELRRTMDAYQDYVNQFTQRVDYLAGSISNSLSTLPRAVNDSANQFLDQIDRMTDALVQAQRLLDNSIVRLYNERKQQR